MEIGQRIKMLADSFLNVSMKFPCLALVYAKCPEKIPEYCVDDECTSDPSFLIEQEGLGRLCINASSERTNPFELALADVEYPAWQFDERDSPWTLGIWGLWLQRDFGRLRWDGSTYTRDECVEHQKCLQSYSVLLAQAGRLAYEYRDELRMPDSVFCNEGFGIGTTSKLSPPALWWLLVLTQQCNVSYRPKPMLGSDEHMQVAVLSDVGDASVHLLTKLPLERLSKKASLKSNKQPSLLCDVVETPYGSIPAIGGQLEDYRSPVWPYCLDNRLVYWRERMDELMSKKRSIEFCDGRGIAAEFVTDLAEWIPVSIRFVWEDGEPYHLMLVAKDGAFRLIRNLEDGITFEPFEERGLFQWLRDFCCTPHWNILRDRNPWIEKYVQSLIETGYLWPNGKHPSHKSDVHNDAPISESTTALEAAEEAMADLVEEELLRKPKILNLYRSLSSRKHPVSYETLLQEGCGTPLSLVRNIERLQEFFNENTHFGLVVENFEAQSRVKLKKLADKQPDTPVG